MKTPPSRTAKWDSKNAVWIVEVVVWVVITFYARQQLDLAATAWHIPAIWLLLIKIAALLALIGIAVALHSALYRWLVNKGILPPEKPQS